MPQREEVSPADFLIALTGLTEACGRLHPIALLGSLVAAHRVGC